MFLSKQESIAFTTFLMELQEIYIDEGGPELIRRVEQRKAAICISK